MEPASRTAFDELTVVNDPIGPDLGSRLAPPPYVRQTVPTRCRYESVYSGVDRLLVIGFAATWLGASVLFWHWWLSDAHILSVGGLTLTSVVMGLTWVAPLWSVLGVLRSSRPTTEPTPGLRIALTITRAPSEPFSLVQRGLTAMLDQEYDDPYDVWLCDENPTDEIRKWCASRGVRVSSRQGVGEYNQTSWPRRERCKEGNLAYFYDHWGYELYDVVCHFDADHAPSRSYLYAVMSAFTDRSIAYVAAPSQCDANADRSWSARARLFSEAALHGAIQAGHNDGLAPLCIGSHYAVRTEALRRIGGIGPELAEDYTTTLLLNARGYSGAFAIDAVAHGHGPNTIGDAVVQEMQWARSMTTIYLEIAPPLWKRLPFARRCALGFSSLWYPLVSLQMVLGHVLIVAALLTGEAWVDVPIPEFVILRLMPILPLLGLQRLLRDRSLLRPRRSKVASWEAPLMALLRWPWVAAGVVQAVLGHLLGKPLTWKVTPKIDNDARSLPMRVVAPHLVLGAILCFSVAIHGSDSTAGYALIALTVASLYAGAVGVAAVLHARENPRLPHHQVAAPILGSAMLATAVVVAAFTDLHAFSRMFDFGSSGEARTGATDAIVSLVRQPTSIVYFTSLTLLLLWSTIMSRSRDAARAGQRIIDLRGTAA